MKNVFMLVDFWFHHVQGGWETVSCIHCPINDWAVPMSIRK
jgi:hypothetical protein